MNQKTKDIVSVLFAKIAASCILFLVFLLFFFFDESAASAQIPESLDNKMKLSLQYESEKNYSEAFNIIASTKFPEEFEYLKLLRMGWLKQQQNKPVEAIPFYREADSLQAKSIEAKEGLLNNYFSAGQYYNADRIARKILRIYPLHYSSRYRLAELALMNLNYTEAEFHLKKIIKHYPTDFAANKLLLECYSKQKNYSKAEKVESFLSSFYPPGNENK